jgi:hypothetical protein
VEESARAAAVFAAGVIGGIGPLWYKSHSRGSRIDHKLFTMAAKSDGSPRKADGLPDKESRLDIR